VCDAALCTSGDYERRVDGDTTVGHSPSPGEHHLLNPHTGRSPQETISASVLAPTAMVADALATAAFVLGSSAGVALLERHALRGCLVDAEMTCHFTKDWPDV
jgi:thiamine biosynthesis lipoprotein